MKNRNCNDFYQGNGSDFVSDVNFYEFMKNKKELFFMNENPANDFAETYVKICKELGINNEDDNCNVLPKVTDAGYRNKYFERYLRNGFSIRELFVKYTLLRLNDNFRIEFINDGGENKEGCISVGSDCDDALRIMVITDFGQGHTTKNINSFYVSDVTENGLCVVDKVYDITNCNKNTLKEEKELYNLYLTHPYCKIETTKDSGEIKGFVVNDLMTKRFGKCVVRNKSGKCVVRDEKNDKRGIFLVDVGCESREEVYSLGIKVGSKISLCYDILNTELPVFDYRETKDEFLSYMIGYNVKHVCSIPVMEYIMENIDIDKLKKNNIRLFFSFVNEETGSFENVSNIIKPEISIYVSRMCGENNISCYVEDVDTEYLTETCPVLFEFYKKQSGEQYFSNDLNRELGEVFNEKHILYRMKSSSFTNSYSRICKTNSSLLKGLLKGCENYDICMWSSQTAIGIPVISVNDSLCKVKWKTIYSISDVIKTWIEY